LADPQPTGFTQSGRLSTIDRAQGMESPLAKDRHPNHRATPPTIRRNNNIVHMTLYIFYCAFNAELEKSTALHLKSSLCCC